MAVLTARRTASATASAAATPTAFVSASTSPVARPDDQVTIQCGVQISITGNMVILAAGTLGSTEILLRSRERGLSLSEKLGKGFSGNGDEMVIGRDLDFDVNAVAVGVPPRAKVSPVRPATVAMIQYRDENGDGTTVLLQDGTMLPLMAMMAPLKALTELDWKRACPIAP